MFTDYLKEPFQRMTDFQGRASRKQYWMWVLWVIIFSFAVSLVSGLLGLTNPRTGESPLSFIFNLIFFLPTLGLMVRRLHDQNLSGWWLFIPIIPLIVMVPFIPGNKGKNKYGAKPTK